MTEDEVIEKMARAIRDGLNDDGTFDVRSPDECSLDDQEQAEWDAVCRSARAIPSLLPSLGLVVVPVEAVTKTTDYLNRLEAAMVEHDLDIQITQCAPPSLVAEQLSEAAASPFYKGERG